MRLGLPPRSVEVEALRLHLGLPEFGGFVEDAVVAKGLRELKARRTFAETGVASLKKAVPALRAAVMRDGAIAWTIRTMIPILDGGRLDLRIDAAPETGIAGILAGMAHRNDPTWRLDELRAAVAETSVRTAKALRRAVERLRDQVAEDLREVGGRRRHLYRPPRPVLALAGLPALAQPEPVAHRHPEGRARPGPQRGARGFAPAPPARSGGLRGLHREIHRRASPWPADHLPHGADEFRQDVCGPGDAARRAHRHLPRAPAPPRPGELRGPGRAWPAGRHGHRRGDPGRPQPDPHGAHHRNRRSEPAHRGGGDRRDPDDFRPRPGLGLDQRPVRCAGPHRRGLRLGRCARRRAPGGGGRRRIPRGGHLRAQDAAGAAGGTRSPREGDAGRRRGGLLAPGRSREPRDPGGGRAPGWRRSTARSRRRSAVPRPRASAPARPTSSSPPTPSAWGSTSGP